MLPWLVAPFDELIVLHQRKATKLGEVPLHFVCSDRFRGLPVDGKCDRFRSRTAVQIVGKFDSHRFRACHG